MGVLSNKIDREEVKAGDHIYSWRAAYIYAHHGIYAGDGMVIHFTGGGQEIGTGTILERLVVSSSPIRPADDPCAKCGDQSKLNGVISSCLDCFLNGGHLYRFEYGVSPAIFIAQARGGTCTLAPSDPPEDVLHRARYLLQNGFGVYNVSKNNCEDFAIYCKTSLIVPKHGRSGQAASYMAAIGEVISSPLRSLLLTTSFTGLAVIGCGMYCVKRLVSDIGVSRDAVKVPVKMLVHLFAMYEPANTNEVNKPVELSTLDKPANTNEVNGSIEPPSLDEPASTDEVTRPKELPSLDEPTNTNQMNMPIEPSSLDEPANTNEVNRPIESSGLDEQAKANKVKEE